ncbi:MAG: glycosyl transferase/hydrolase, partial [Candidatus Peregrinibacteria bacterium Greene1014_49]
EPYTGNATTARRIAGYLQSHGHTVTLLDTRKASADSVRTMIEGSNIDAVLGIHALGAGRLLFDLPIPTVIIFGGTDLNEHARNPRDLQTMTEAVEHACALVAFTEDARQRAENLWPECKQKIRVIPQGVLTHPSAFSLRKAIGLRDDDILFLLPAGLRPVKDPLMLVEEIAQWHRENPRVHLVIIGADRDPTYAQKCRHIAMALPGIQILPPIPADDLHAAMKESNAILNSSHSEGLCNTLLEAMHVGTPVLARDIPGNRALVAHRETGMLFATPEEFSACAMQLRNDSVLRTHIITSARKMVETEYAPDREAEAYAKLFSELSW